MAAGGMGNGDGLLRGGRAAANVGGGGKERSARGGKPHVGPRTNGARWREQHVAGHEVGSLTGITLLGAIKGPRCCIILHLHILLPRDNWHLGWSSGASRVGRHLAAAAAGMQDGQALAKIRLHFAPTPIAQLLE